ncbi:MAG: galactose mutarotase [Bacteroidales bacterium]|nr:galactose mutarotase [Bacteroidales bacterium]
MKSEKISFGSYQNKEIIQYILENDNGMVVKIINYGATITSVSIPSGDNSRVDLVCGFDTLEGYFSEEYKANAPYFGCTVGRYAGRIKDGRFEVDGREYKLVQNDGTNHLHGGSTGFDKKVWEGDLFDHENGTGVKMQYESSHLEEGYPGNLQVIVRFLLTPYNEIKIGYEATTDHTTPLSLTNHTYFNLNGFSSDILNHITRIQASRFQKPDPTNVPVGEEQEVEGTPADLRQAVELAGIFTKQPKGFEHYYIFDKEAGTYGSVAEFSDPASGRSLKVSTDEPGMLFYTGFYTSDSLERESGDNYGRFRAFCCETGRYHNGPNIPSPGSFLNPGETFETATVFKFDW